MQSVSNKWSASADESQRKLISPQIAVVKFVHEHEREKHVKLIAEIASYSSICVNNLAAVGMCGCVLKLHEPLPAITNKNY